MAEDLYQETRAELEAALTVLEPQLRGLRDLELVSISQTLLVQVQNEEQIRETRRQLIQNVLDAMDAVNAAMAALEANGYPDYPDSDLPPELDAELIGQQSDIDAAIAIFEPAVTATSMSITTRPVNA